MTVAKSMLLLNSCYCDLAEYGVECLPGYRADCPGQLCAETHRVQNDNRDPALGMHILILCFLFVLALSNYGSCLFDYFFWQKSLVELITSGSAGTWPVLFRNTVDFRPGHCSVDVRQIP